MYKGVARSDLVQKAGEERSCRQWRNPFLPSSMEFARFPRTEVYLSCSTTSEALDWQTRDKRIRRVTS